jgi:hypothetical protein
MNFDSYALSSLFEKSLIRLTADFESEKNPKSVVSELSKALKTKISSSEPSAYNFQVKRTEDGVYHLVTSFVLYRDARLIAINLLKWIEREGTTSRNNNFLVDLKFMDEVKGPFKGTLFSTATKIENIDKLRFILEFDEQKIYKAFPTRKDSFISQSIVNFEPTQKFIPKEKEAVDPRVYRVPPTDNCGVNFETLTQGFLRMQYIGGSGYEKKVEDVLSAINQFCVTAWDCTVNRGFTRENLVTFEKAIAVRHKIREAYYDYSIFKKNFPKIVFSVDLVSNDKVLESYYQILRDRIYDIISNLDIRGEFEMNYDTVYSVFQIKDANISGKNLAGIEFIKCKITYGTYSKCDFFDCEIQDATLNQCNLYLHTHVHRSNLFNSYANRTTEITKCDFDGMAGVLNGKMTEGVFRTGKVGLFADISPQTVVIQYQPLKAGYMVAGDQIIVPTKKYRLQ